MVVLHENLNFAGNMLKNPKKISMGAAPGSHQGAGVCAWHPES